MGEVKFVMKGGEWDESCSITLYDAVAWGFSPGPELAL